MMKYIGIVILTIGIGLLAYSMTFEPFTNNEEFYKKMYSLRNVENNSEKFHELRDSYLTPKYSLENYGLTYIILGLYTLILIPKNWRNFKTPKNKALIIIVGVLAVLLTIVAYVGDLFIEMTRYRYPPWADSLGIPLMVTPGLLLIFSGWFAVNLIGLKNPFRTSVSITEFDLKSTNYWYFTLIVLTIISTLTVIYDGDFWLTAAGTMWIYFYLTLMLGRQREKEKATPQHDI